mmetsp:Transcript_16401/g.39659  ORF Transcript_16401/g.39659 Transcript_16401/m.39659 type:complete len:135 (-) Transcript_16401:139-543(-)
MRTGGLYVMLLNHAITSGTMVFEAKLWQLNSVTPMKSGRIVSSKPESSQGSIGQRANPPFRFARAHSTEWTASRDLMADNPAEIPTRVLCGQPQRLLCRLGLQCALTQVVLSTPSPLWLGACAGGFGHALPHGA